jgi:hypothetical protein
MIIRITILWVLGLITIVPYSIHHLLYYAQRDEYALLITLVLFWIFGFWVWSARSYLPSRSAVSSRH